MHPRTDRFEIASKTDCVGLRSEVSRFSATRPLRYSEVRSLESREFQEWEMLAERHLLVLVGVRCHGPPWRAIQTALSEFKIVYKKRKEKKVLKFGGT